VTHVLIVPLADLSGDPGVIDMALLSVIRRWHFLRGDNYDGRLSGNYDGR
jgi:hypothetical protein